MSNEFRVVAVDVANRPEGIPTSKWIEKEEVYTVIKVDFLTMPGVQTYGFQLEEIDLSDCVPYTYFRASRFRPFTEEDALIQQKVEDLLNGDIQEYSHIMEEEEMSYDIEEY